MIIRKINLSSFGKFNDKIIELDPNLNILYGGNEAGKSTILKFVETMVASINSLSMNLNDDEVKRLLPWSNVNKFEGEIYFEHNHEQYKMHKNFLVDDLNAKVYKINNDGSEELVENNKALHFSTLSMRNITNISGKELIDDITTRIINKVITNDEGIIYTELIQKVQTRIDEIKSAEDYSAKVKYIEANENCRDIEKSKKTKEFYMKRESLNDQKEKLKEDSQRLHDEIVDLSHTLQVIHFFRILEINAKLEKNNGDIEKVEHFDSVNFDDYSEYFQLQKELVEKDRHSREIKKEIRELKYKQEKVVADNNGVLLHKIEDENYYNTFIEELRTYEQISREEQELEGELEKISDKLKDFNARTASVPHVDDIEKDHHKFITEYNLVQVNQQTSNAIVNEDKNANEINRLSTKRNTYGFFGVVVIMMTIIALSMKFVLPQYTNLWIILGIVFMVVALVLIAITMSINFNVKKLKYVSDFLKNQNRVEVKEIDISKDEIERILKKYKCKSKGEFDALYTNVLGLLKGVKIYKRDEYNFNSRLHNIKSKIEELTNKIEMKIDQCAMASFSLSSGIEGIMDELQKHFEIRQHLNMQRNNILELEKTYHGASENIEECRSKLDNDKATMFREYSYDEILEKKNILKELHESNEQLVLEKGKITETISEDDLLDKFKNIHMTKEEAKELRFDENEYNQKTAKRQNIIEKVHKIESEISNINEQILQLNKEMVEERQKEKKVELFKSKIKDSNDEISDLKYVLEKFNTTTESIKESVYPVVMASIDENILKITKKYTNLLIDDDMNILLKNLDGTSCQLDDVSLGTIDQICFAIRLGLMKAFREEGEMAVVLDDAFVQYDVGRFENVMDVVRSLNEQVILLTCYEREREYANKHQAHVNYIEI